MATTRRTVRYVVSMSRIVNFQLLSNLVYVCHYDRLKFTNGSYFFFIFWDDISKKTSFTDPFGAVDSPFTLATMYFFILTASLQSRSQSFVPLDQRSGMKGLGASILK